MNIRITEHVKVVRRRSNIKKDNQTFPAGMFNPYKENVGIMANYGKGDPDIHRRPVDYDTGFVSHKTNKKGKS